MNKVTPVSGHLDDFVDRMKDLDKRLGLLPIINFEIIKPLLINVKACTLKESHSIVAQQVTSLIFGSHAGGIDMTEYLPDKIKDLFAQQQTALDSETQCLVLTSEQEAIVLRLLMHRFINEEDKMLLRELITGKRIHRKLNFDGAASQFVDLWARIKNGSYTPLTTKVLSAWIKRNFTWKGKAFSDSVLQKYMGGTRQIPVQNRIGSEFYR